MQMHLFCYSRWRSWAC